MIRLLLGRPCWILRITRVPQNVQLGNRVEVQARSAVYGASQNVTIENRIFRDVKVTFDLDFDIGSHTYIMPEMN